MPQQQGLLRQIEKRGGGRVGLGQIWLEGVVTMSMLTLLAAWLIIATAPNTSIGRALRGWLIVVPARWLNALRRGHVALAVMLVVTGIVMFWLGGGDGLSVAGFAVPDVAAWVATFEITVYLDLAIVAVTTWSTLPTRALRDRLRFTSTRRHCRPGGRRTRKRRTLPASADNDDEEGYWLLAAA